MIGANQVTNHPFLRKALRIIFGIALALTIYFAALSGFVFDGPSPTAASYGFFYSAMALPLSIGLALWFSKKTLFIYLIPVIPLIFLIYYNGKTSKETATSNVEWCKEVVAKNYRDVLENPTSPCYHADLKN